MDNSIGNCHKTQFGNNPKPQIDTSKKTKPQDAQKSALKKHRQEGDGVRQSAVFAEASAKVAATKTNIPTPQQAGINVEQAEVAPAVNPQAQTNEVDTIAQNQRTVINSDMRQQIDALFTADNFVFSTKKEGRKPTLYFAEGGLANLNSAPISGRLRQEHKNGCVIKFEKPGTIHVFLESKKDVGKIADKIKQTDDPFLFYNSLSENCRKPTPDAYHVEFFSSKKPGGSTKLIPHRSSGQIKLSLTDLGLGHRTEDFQEIIENILNEGGEVVKRDLFN